MKSSSLEPKTHRRPGSASENLAGLERRGDLYSATEWSKLNIFGRESQFAQRNQCAVRNRAARPFCADDFSFQLFGAF
jgi:hypothetical protein